MRRDGSENSSGTGATPPPETEVRLSDVLTPEGRTVRQEVFVEEQGYLLEFDETDATARHAVVFCGGMPAAAGRVYFEGEAAAVLGRLAVRRPFRGRGLGRTLVLALEADARKAGAKSFRLSAQLHAVPFYEKLGYTSTEEQCADEGRPHRIMTKRA